MPSNPLLTYTEFVPYQQIRAEHIVPAVKESITKAQAELETILKLLDKPLTDLNFTNTLHALIEMEEIVERVWTPVQNLLSLMGSDDIRDAANEARPLIVEFFNNYALDPRVYQLIRKYSESPDAKSLTGEMKRHLRNTLIDFKLSGAELEGEAKEEFKKLNLKLSELGQKFSDNSTDSKFELIITDKKDLSGLPEDIVQGAKRKADELREEGAKIPEGAWVFNLDYPSYGPFMKFADNGALRKQMYIQYLSQGTERATRGILGADKKDSLNNEPLIKEIFQAKLRKSNLLGYKSYAHVSLETKMAPSPEAVTTFLERIATKSRALAEQEYAELVKFQKEINYQNTESNPNKIYPWDKEYLSEKLRKARYDLDSNLLKPYFELKNTIQGMFHIAETLYGIKLQKVPSFADASPGKQGVEVWHPDVEVYEIRDLNNLSEKLPDARHASSEDTELTDTSMSSPRNEHNTADGTLRIGYFYMDLYPRDTKRQGAWVMPLVAACQRSDGTTVLPQCALVCNLTKPHPDQPSLLTHVEVVTLFHEFGHAMHHLFSKVKLEPLSGTNVEWDFVELPSQLNENFCWEEESLKTFAKHYQTGKNIPDELLNKMLAARNFNEGLACMRQLEFGLFDLAIYMRETDKDYRAPLEILQEIVAKYGLFEVWEGTNFPCAFSHIFAGGYAAGYYSYKWAEALEADAFSRFKAAGVLSSSVGKDYREKILERGDSVPPMELFKDFMGREPREEALLERMGL